MGTKNCPGDFDCFTAADPDEPMFVLLGRDASAGALVRLWVSERASKHAEDTVRDAQISGSGGVSHDDVLKLHEALRCADALDAWAVAKGKMPRSLGVQIVKTHALEEIAQACALLVDTLTPEERNSENPPGLLERIRRLPTRR